MSTQATLPGADDESDPERGEQRAFWEDKRAQRRYISKRGRRDAPANTLIDEVGDEHWVRVEDGETRGVGVYEWQPPDPGPDPRSLSPDTTPVVTKTDPSDILTPVESPAEEEGVKDEPTETESDEQEATEEDSAGDAPDALAPPPGSSISVLVETEHATLFQEGSHYTVEIEATGDSITLPGDEWAEFASYLKRGSRVA